MLTNDKIIMSRAATKIGVFMPCYNLGDYIDEALDSLYAQTFDNFSLIIADDASSLKSTVQKLKTINRPRSKIYYENRNLGLIRIANKYMARLDAEYIMLFSPDDKMHKDFLKEQVEYLDSHPEVHAACTWIQEFGEGKSVIKYSDKMCTLPYMLVGNHFSGAALVRKSAWLAAGKHDTNKKLYPNLDYDLWLSMLAKGFKLGTIQKPLFYWRVSHSSLSHRVNPAQILIFRREILKKYSALYEKHSNFVTNHYLGVISEFEEYYELNEAGHDWLDKQYHSLIKKNTDLIEENALLSARLASSIQFYFIRSVLGKIKRRFQRKP